MLAIIDYRAPQEVKDNLKSFTEDLFEFQSVNITHDSISGHPDIFIYQDDSNLIIAPNAPEELFVFLNKYKIEFQIGSSNVGYEIRDSVPYNCVSTPDYLFHKTGMTDSSIINVNKSKQFIPLPQAFTHCSLTHITEEIFFTSDKGIEKVLKKHCFDHIFISPDKISIFGHKHGFVGGTNGIWEKRIFFMGDINKHSDGKNLKIFVENLGFEIICLGQDYLYDGGGIFFLKEN